MIHKFQPLNNPKKELMGRWGMIFLFSTLALLILFVPLPLLGTAPMNRHIRIEASMFQFDPGEVRVNPGDRVTMELVSTDVVHGLSLDGYDFELIVDPGQSKTSTFIADKTGVFRFRCSVACGNLHPFMIGKMHVGPNLLLLRGIGLGLLSIATAIFSLRIKIQSTARITS